MVVDSQAPPTMDGTWQSQPYGPSWPCWKDNPDTDTDSSSLCVRCQHVDFRWLIDNDLEFTKLPHKSIKETLRTRDCAFCRLLAVAIRLEILQNEAFREGIEKLDGPCIIYGLFDYTLPNKDVSKKTISVDLGEQWTWDLPNEVYLETYELCDPRQTIVKSMIDFSQVKSWLEQCEIDPGAPVSPLLSLPQPRALRLIDVRSRCLVDAPKNARYIALSYCWGVKIDHLSHFSTVHSNLKERYQIGGLAETDTRIPYTISDAIRVTRLLGERYIWVDSMCIIQDCLEDKGVQIDDMTSTYVNAHLTIVALSGDIADSGLPGVREDSRRDFHRTETVDGIMLANRLPSLKAAKSTSIWPTRAWTYQEEVLSQKLLFFSDTQVYFTHGAKYFSEDFGTHEQSSDEADNQDSSFVSPRSPLLLDVYADHVVQITSRNLSFQEDAMRTFAGIADALEVDFRGKFLYGLPTTSFDFALLWNSPGSMLRRRDTAGNDLFPSWSWLGWIGPIDLPRNSCSFRTLSCISWRQPQLFGNDRVFRTADDANRTIIQENLESSTWNEVLIDSRTIGYYETDNPGTLYDHPILPLPSNPAYKSNSIFNPYRLQQNITPPELMYDRLLMPPPMHCSHLTSLPDSGHSPHIQFFAWTAMMRVKDFGAHGLQGVKFLDLGDELISTERRGMNRFFLTGRLGKVAGYIDIQLGYGEVELMVLSRTTFSQDISLDPALEDGVLVLPPSIDDHTEERRETNKAYKDQWRERRQGNFDMPRGCDYMTFDPSGYSMHKPWPIYNVMAIERKNGIAYRAALGRVHVDAFWEFYPKRSLITLG